MGPTGHSRAVAQSAAVLSLEPWGLGYSPPGGARSQSVKARKLRGLCKVGSEKMGLLKRQDHQQARWDSCEV